MSDEDWGDADEGWGSGGDEEDWGDVAGSEGEEEQEGGDDVRIRIENLFFEAEDNRRRDPQGALQQFEECVKLEEEIGEEVTRRFKALEHIVVLHFMLQDNKGSMVTRYKQLLALTPSVTRNEISESINNVLNAVSESKDFDVLKEFYEVTLSALKSLSGQERMWFSISMKLCKTYIDRAELSDATRMLRELHDSCRLADGKDDPTKGSQLLEIYALDSQLSSMQGDNVRLKELFEKTKHLSSEINDPRSMSIIRECWGKMYANQGKYKEAYTEFFDSFLQYQEIGHERAKQCLKYVVISNMLSASEANPFDTREAKVYQQHPEIEPVLSLRLAYDNNDIRRFQRVLDTKHAHVTADPFINGLVEPLLLRIRSQALCDLVKPYTRVRLAFIAKFLDTDVNTVEQLLVRLILDNAVRGRIDQVKGILNLDAGSQESHKRYHAIEQWASSVAVLSSTLTAKCASSDHQSRESGLHHMHMSASMGSHKMMDLW